jgi:hypothetical protein
MFDAYEVVGGLFKVNIFATIMSLSSAECDESAAKIYYELEFNS